jgi:hypothetical protein
MAFVKLDCGMLDSSIWGDREARELFITALLMAEPVELVKPKKQLEVRTLAETGFEVPAGWYGFVAASGTGIIKRAGMEMEAGLAALERLGAPEYESRTPYFEGRRLVRIEGGYLALNFQRYREKDHTAAERSRRYRERLAGKRPKPPSKTRRQVRASNLAREERFVKATEAGDEDRAGRIAAGEE